MSDFRATIDGVGCWNGREEYAVKRWNTHVLPTIKEALEIADSAFDYDDQRERIAYAVDKAWEAFCTEGGSRAAVRAFKKHI